MSAAAQSRPAARPAVLGLDLPRLAALYAVYGREAFLDYFGELSADELRDILMGFDPQTLLLPELARSQLLSRLAWFAEAKADAGQGSRP